MKQYYLDYNATCPQLPEVTLAMQDVASYALATLLACTGQGAMRGVRLTMPESR